MSNDDALWLSWAANGQHGLPRSREAKRCAIRAALCHPRWKKESDRAIARHIGCDHKTVAAMRRANRGGEFPTAASQEKPKPSKEAILEASQLLARVQPEQEADFEHSELAVVRAGYEAVHRLLFGAKTLPRSNKT